jgi:hypothetical protein
VLGGVGTWDSRRLSRPGKIGKEGNDEAGWFVDGKFRNTLLGTNYYEELTNVWVCHYVIKEQRKRRGRFGCLEVWRRWKFGDVGRLAMLEVGKKGGL